LKEQGLISITKAAGLIGVHPNTLRSWADKGLVGAVRLPSGYRRFTLEEIRRVRKEMGLEDIEVEGKLAA
jgi:DNA-binding transcriptional MerR regulator